MPFRNTPTDDENALDAEYLVSAREHLMTTAARGRRRLRQRKRSQDEAARCEQHRKQQRAAREWSKAQRQQRQRLERSLSWGAHIQFWVFSADVLSKLAIMLIIIVLIVLGAIELGAPMRVVLVGAVLVVLVVPLLTHYVLVPSAVRREQRWLAGLPFELASYFEELCEEPRRRAFQLVFHRSVPAPDLLRDLLAGHDLLLSEAIDAAAHIYPVPSSPGDNNRGLHRWTHRLVQAMIPLHAVYPIKRIRIVERR